jgi:hypothetical protein
MVTLHVRIQWISDKMREYCRLYQLVARSCIASQYRQWFVAHIWKREITIGTAEPSIEAVHCSIQPNPASGEAWLLMDEIPGEDWTVEITDVTSRRVLEMTLDDRQQVQLLPLTGFSPGVYFVTLRDTHNVLARRRLVVVR